MEINYIVQISVRLRHFDQAERVEKSPRKRPYKAFIKLCYCEARSGAVAIPRKGSSRLRLLGAMTHYGQLGNIAPKHSSTLKEYPHSAATPTAHPRRVDTRNEICLTANEILLRKVKSNKLDEIRTACRIMDRKAK